MSNPPSDANNGSAEIQLSGQHGERERRLHVVQWHQRPCESLPSCRCPQVWPCSGWPLFCGFAPASSGC